MAIKINNTTVIDDSRNFIGVALTATSIYAGGSIGAAGNVLTSTGSGISWSESGDSNITSSLFS